MIFVVLAIRLRSEAFFSKRIAPVRASMTQAQRAERAVTGAHRTAAASRAAAAIPIVRFIDITGTIVHGNAPGYSSTGSSVFLVFL